MEFRDQTLSCDLPVPTQEGTNILTRNIIIFGQGALRCHPYLMRECEAAANPDPHNGLCEFDTSLFQHIGHLLRNPARCLWVGAHPRTPLRSAGIG